VFQTAKGMALLERVLRGVDSAHLVVKRKEAA
jgi:hypothetical protein